MHIYFQAKVKRDVKVTVLCKLRNKLEIEERVVGYAPSFFATSCIPFEQGEYTECGKKVAPRVFC